jgi:hypothetical protein
MNRRREREEQRARDEQRQAELARWHTEQQAAAEADTAHAGRSIEPQDDSVAPERPGV